MLAECEEIIVGKIQKEDGFTIKTIAQIYLLVTGTAQSVV